MNDDIFKSLRAIQDAVNPPWRRAITAMQDAVNPPWLRAITAMQDAVKPARGLDQLMRTVSLGVVRDVGVAPSLVRSIANLSRSNLEAALGRAEIPGWNHSISRLVSRQLGGTLQIAELGTRSQVLAHLGKEQGSGAVENTALRGLGLHLAKFSGHHQRIEHAQVIGALRLAAEMSPQASLGSLLGAIGQAQSSLVGKATMFIARAFPFHSHIAMEALSTLAALELPDFDNEQVEQLTQDSPLAHAVVELQGAAAASEVAEEFAEHLAQALDRIVENLQNQRRSPKAATLDISSVVAFVSLLVAAISMLLAAMETQLAASSEIRALRQDEAASTAQRTADERATKLQQALDRVVELNEHKVTQREASAASEGKPGPTAEYIVDRAVILRAHKSTSSRRVDTLYPGTVVTVVEQSGRSVRVKHFDHLRGEERIGWVMKKYLVRIHR